MDKDHQRSGMRRLGLAFIGLSLALAATLGWSASARALAPAPPAHEAGVCPRPQDRNGLAYLTGRAGAAAAGGNGQAGIIGFPCDSKTCLICEQNGGNCAPIDGQPGRCTCE